MRGRPRPRWMDDVLDECPILEKKCTRQRGVERSCDGGQTSLRAAAPWMMYVYNIINLCNSVHQILCFFCVIVILFEVFKFTTIYLIVYL